ncbi:MAG: hypothetical protein L0Y80_06070 [Ignavibacteriae bacterium]|nr:hypothetical protein [Ignavibacteriota bacterium]
MRTILCLALVSFVSLSMFAQNNPTTDTTIVFEPSSPDLIASTQYQPLRNAWGIDLMVSNNGFGLGGFWRHEYTDELSGFISLALSDVKDEAEVEYFNQFTGQSFVPGKKNRLLMLPVTFGVQYRLFKDDIVDNFRPFLSAGIGPSMVFVAPYSKTTVYDLGNGQTYTDTEQIEFFSSLKYGQAKYTVGGFIGGGAYFGLDKGTLSGVSFRYYFIPFKKGIEILDQVYVKHFGGFFITLNFGSMY